MAIIQGPRVPSTSQRRDPKQYWGRGVGDALAQLLSGGINEVERGFNRSAQKSMMQDSQGLPQYYENTAPQAQQRMRGEKTLNDLSALLQAGGQEGLGALENLIQSDPQMSQDMSTLRGAQAERSPRFRGILPEDEEEEVEDLPKLTLPKSFYTDEEQKILDKRKRGEKLTPEEKAQIPTQSELNARRRSATDLLKLEEKRRAEVQKETLPYYKDVIKESKAARNNNLRLKKMSSLVKKGSLPISTFYNLLEEMGDYNFGKDIPLVGPLLGSVINPVVQMLGGAGRAIQRNVTSKDTEQYEKLVNDFTREAKSIFGSRVTDFDLRALMKMIPSLSISDRGKKAIIKNMKTFNRVLTEREDVMRDIIKKNKGSRPPNLDLLVEKKIGPKLDQIAKEFKQNLQDAEKIAAPVVDLFNVGKTESLV